MKLSFTMSIEIKKGLFPEFINTLAAGDAGVKEVHLEGDDALFEKYRVRAVSSDAQKMKYCINLLKGRSDDFRGIVLSNDLEEAVGAGMLEVKCSLPVKNETDYEMNILGGLSLVAERIDSAENPSGETGIKKAVAVISVLKKKKDNEKMYCWQYSQCESDALLASELAGLNAFPFIVEYEIVEDFFKALRSFQRSFSSMRFAHIEDGQDVSLYSQLEDNLSLPVLSYQNDEVPFFVMASVGRMLSKHSMKISECNIGLIGLDSSSMRLTNLFRKRGCQRVLGYDSSEKAMLYFERCGGLATNPENIFGNSDVVIVMKNCFAEEDLQRMRPNLLVISLLDDAEQDEKISDKKACKEILCGRWFEPASFFPHILKAMPDLGKKSLDDADILKLADLLESEIGKDMKLPGVFSGISSKIYEALK